jgi:hypothetical protein
MRSRQGANGASSSAHSKWLNATLLVKWSVTSVAVPKGGGASSMKVRGTGS